MEIKVVFHAIDQYQIMVSGRRVGYVCLGEGAAINWLTKKTIGLELTDAEKITVAKSVREQMAKINAEAAAQDSELAALTNPVKAKKSK